MEAKVEKIEKAFGQVEENLTKTTEYMKGFCGTEADISKKVHEFGMQKLAPIVDKLGDAQKAYKGLLRELDGQ